MNITPTDMFDRPINSGDYVLFGNKIYKVIETQKIAPNTLYGYVKIMLVNSTESTRMSTLFSKELFVLHPEDIIAMKLKYGF